MPADYQVGQEALPMSLQSFGGTIQDPNNLIMGLDWSLGRLYV